jgi:hypothetical protein
MTHTRLTFLASRALHSFFPLARGAAAVLERSVAFVVPRLTIEPSFVDFSVTLNWGNACQAGTL